MKYITPRTPATAPASFQNDRSSYTPLIAAGPQSDIARPFTGCYQQPSYSRAGNYYASHLREIHEDSFSVFPESVYSQVQSRRNRWSSIYNSDFIPVQEAGYEQFIRDNYPEIVEARVNPDIYSKLAGRSNTDLDQMFMKWKVPERLTTPASSRLNTARDAREEDVPVPTVKVQETVVPQVTAKSHRIASPLRGCSPAKPAERVKSPPKSESPRPPPSLARMSMTGLKSMKRTGEAKVEAPPAPPRSPRAMSPRRVGLIPLRGNRGFRTQMLLKDFVNKPEEIAAQEYWKTAGELEKKMVAKTLKMMEQDNGDLEALRSVQDWLDGATEEERDAALQFFQIVADAKMASIEVHPDKKERVQQIIFLLKNYDNSHLHLTGKATGAQTARDFTDVNKELARLRQLRLLTPHTRANKWMHKTWHHMPPIKDRNPVNNSSAIYSEAGVVPHRHWNIHPDWKLQL